jgi:hypothetical protein
MVGAFEAQECFIVKNENFFFLFYEDSYIRLKKRQREKDTWWKCIAGG